MVPGALDKACRAWAPWMDGRTACSMAPIAAAFPYLRVRGNVSLHRAVVRPGDRAFLWQPASSSTGRRPGWPNFWTRRERRASFRVVMIHHPPRARRGPATTSALFGIGRFSTHDRQAWRGTGSAWPHASCHHIVDRQPAGAHTVPVVGVPDRWPEPRGRPHAGAIQPVPHRRYDRRVVGETHSPGHHRPRKCIVDTVKRERLYGEGKPAATA